MKNGIRIYSNNLKLSLLNLCISTAVFAGLLKLNYELFPVLNFNYYVYVHYIVFILFCYFSFKLFKKEDIKFDVASITKTALISLGCSAILYYLVASLMYKMVILVVFSIAFIML